MPWSSYALDTFMAPKLSQLSSCGAPELATSNTQIAPFLLNSILGVKLPEPFHRLAFNFIRRVDQASHEYAQGRDYLLKYLQTQEPLPISLYFQALTHFEQTLAMLYQAAMFCKELTGTWPYEQGDHSLFDRINGLYNASKHMHGRIAGPHFPADVTVAVWITNDGLECHDEAVTFHELHDALKEYAERARYVAYSTTDAEG